MSHKKHRKHPQKRIYSTNAPTAESEFATNGMRKRMNPKARSLLLVTLVVLALSELLRTYSLIPETVSTIISVISLVLLLIALSIQFGDSGGSSNQAPRL